MAHRLQPRGQSIGQLLAAAKHDESINEEPNQRTNELSAERGTNALVRMDKETMSKVLYPAADGLYRRLLSEDDVYPTLESDREQKDRKRCLRRIALKTATEQIQTEYSVKMTKADMNQRKKDIVRRMERFNRELVDRARASLAAEGQGTIAPSDEDEGADSDIDMAEEEENVPEPDAEELFATDGTTNLMEQNDQDVDHGEQASEVPHHEIVRQVLETPLENEKPKLPDLVCPDCVADETIGEQQKARLWPSQAHLTRHRRSKVHAGYSAWQRRLELRKKEDETEGFRCELCVSVAPDGAATENFDTIDALEEHVTLSNEEGIAGDVPWADDVLVLKHQGLKDELDWDGPEFRASDEVRKRNLKDRAAKRKARGWECEDLEELEESIPVPGPPNIFLGGPSIMSKLQENIVKSGIGYLIRVEDIPVRTPIPMDGIKYGKWPTTDEDIRGVHLVARLFPRLDLVVVLDDDDTKAATLPSPVTRSDLEPDHCGLVVFDFPVEVLTIGPFKHPSSPSKLR
ncbi:hypothetical protein CSAL01_08384 [Colletotrichum salicis]|uniref:Uncharacterized protein n=1 Tax=Colletotrichum salicis TaxID=1209931 RepID=A0A135UL85_9PEZI|nr:hypothetical protein CSAL01_08384 [Colletotrichum salicis]